MTTWTVLGSHFRTNILSATSEILAVENPFDSPSKHDHDQRLELSFMGQLSCAAIMGLLLDV